MISAIITGLAAIAPEIIGLVSGSDAEEKAKQVADIAKAVTGKSDPQEAMDAIKQDPEQARKFKEAFMDYRLKMEQETTKQLTQINETMRADYKESGWKSGWRPFFGYIFASAFGMMIFGFIGLFFYFAGQSLEKAIKLISVAPQFVSAFTPMFGMGLAVLGVAIKKRSDDKTLIGGLGSGVKKSSLIDKVKGIFGKENK